jgi:MoxR-like ATPase
VPGVAKTTLARGLAAVLGLAFRRVQFTPDLLPGDLTGSFMPDAAGRDFSFRPGPVFTHLLLADEINRATPKTQSALLEAMQELQVTVEGHSFALEPPFLVIATQNPIEQDGTYPLPEAELDRFLVRLEIGYPDAAQEARILHLHRRPGAAAPPAAVLDAAGLTALQAAAQAVHVDATVEGYLVALARASREDARLMLGASPRATLALMRLAQALALLDGRDFVGPDDVKAAAVPVLAHRLVLRPEHWGGRLDPRLVVRGLLDRVDTPPVQPPAIPRAAGVA